MALTQVQPGMLASDSQYTGFKNRIINGAQVINQRGATVTAGSTYVTDRWQVDNITTSGSVSFAQNTTAPAGFTYSLKITVTSADAAVGATDLIDFRQWIEGYNIADMGFGTSNSNYFTCSFWVNSSQTGTYGVSFRNSDSSRVYVSTYTVNSASTWEQKTVTIPVDTSGTWLTDNSRGLGIAFTVMAGSNYQGAAGSWGTTNNRTTSAQANLLATNGATFYLTGVQLEKGSTATSFDYRPYGTELQLCQRYYFKNKADNANAALGGVGAYGSTTTLAANFQYPVPMRSAPTASQSGCNNSNGITASAITSITTSYYGNSSAIVQFVSGASFVAAQAGYIYGPTTAAYVDFSAEL
ncbi:hypothetical protein UFOVP248_11 [uncultured Caudovirales phage]|uniref:Uncharacterized protein n=1 Tax=uncultured Caudovirales phage TaxID=2100421 RepID=A0A6J5LGM8_9CAUD|nr:hypothetical protein UFOVP248_11 [uncultured Caudovirales phage]